MTSTTKDTAERVIRVLRGHERELREAGIASLSLFGSVARGEAGMASDVDLAAVIDPASSMDLFRLEALQRRIGQLLGRAADLLPEPVEKRRLQARIDQDRLRVF
ncbi:MAG TPA: nucleotidyltransferase domain-containing protein [Caulobacteraceae bacterium]|jgi:predicted nucleotidyltransferase|nr:nucleotidyltransferase domain-containing protein [Caulobacteraceae bacterium]